MKNKKNKNTEASAIPPLFSLSLSLSPRVSFVAYAWCLLGPYPFISSSSDSPALPPF